MTKLLLNPVRFLDVTTMMRLIEQGHRRVLERGGHPDRYRQDADKIRIMISDQREVVNNVASKALLLLPKDRTDQVPGFGDDDFDWQTPIEAVPSSNDSVDLLRIEKNYLTELQSRLHYALMSERYGFRASLKKLKESLHARAESIVRRRLRGGRADSAEILRPLALAQLSGTVSSARIRDPEESAARIHAEFPWMREASIHFLRDARLPGPFRMRPTILAGGPGTGKTSWASAVAAETGQSPIRIDLAASNGGIFKISGVEAGWSNAAPGDVVTGIAERQLANPVLIIEEVDLAVASKSTNGKTFPGAIYALMSMLEPETAKAWRCPATNAVLDLRGITWIMTTNAPDDLPQPFLDRCTLVTVPDLTQSQLRFAAWRAAEKVQEGLGSVIVAALEERSRRGRPVRSLRSVRRMIETAISTLHSPMVH